VSEIVAHGRARAPDGARLDSVLPEILCAFTIAPGAVETGMLRSIFSDAQIPPEHCLTPEAVGAVIADCVCGERTEDNGRVIWLTAGD
jgi:hypothetical protein